MSIWLLITGGGGGGDVTEDDFGLISWGMVVFSVPRFSLKFAILRQYNPINKLNQRSGKISCFSSWAEILEKWTFSERNKSDDIFICGKG